MDKRTAPVFVLIVMTVLVLVVLGGAYFTRFVLRNNTGDNTGPTACTQEAKLCPDGSTVSRTGPNCEFAACATANNEQPIANTLDTSDWKTYRNEEYGFEVRYPKNWYYREISEGTYSSIHFENLEKDYYMEGGKVSPITVVIQDKQEFTNSIAFTQKQNKYNGIITNLTIGGKEATQLKDYLRVTTNIFYANQIYRIETPNLQETNVEAIYHSVLSTFTFTK